MCGAVGCFDHANAIDHVHALDDFAEPRLANLPLRVGMLEVLLAIAVNEELRSGAVGLGSASGSNGAAFVRETVARFILDGRTAWFLAHARYMSAYLDHEIGNNAMEYRAVVETIIHVLQEIRGRYRRL